LSYKGMFFKGLVYLKNMLIKAFGIIDIIAGLILILNSAFPEKILTVFGIILLVKSSLGFWKDFASWMDLLGGGVLILTTIITMPWIISLIFGILIIQKGIISFM